MASNGPAYAGLMQERQTAIDNINNLSTQVQAVGSTWSIAQITVRTEILEGYWLRFQEAQRLLTLHYSNIEAVMQSISEAESNAVTTFADAKALLADLANQFQANAEPTPHTPRVSDIRLPMFGGKYADWAAWRSEFKAKVLDTGLSAADKISLLLCALEKEAATCAGRAERLDGLELERIWAKLDKTYDNKYQQVFAHIASIINIPQITQPSADKLRSMIDTVDQHMRMLERFGVVRTTWSAIICVLMLVKLDTETRNLWESKDSLPEMPDADALFTYLEQRILAIRNIELSENRIQQPANGSNNGNNGGGKQRGNGNGHGKSRHHPYDKKQSTQPNTASKPPSAPAPNCPQCGNDVKHHLWHCDPFKALTSAQQLEQLKKWGVCEVCLVAKHAANECTKGICPICKTARHNSLVCPQKTSKKVHHAKKRQSRANNRA